jgi:hypothetical protein
MLKFIARFVGFWLIAAALVATVVDGAKSLAAAAVIVTPLGETWATIAALLGGADGAPVAERQAAPWLFELALNGLLSAPTVLVLAGAGIFFLVIGAKRRRPVLGREFA